MLERGTVREVAKALHVSTGAVENVKANRTPQEGVLDRIEDGLREMGYRLAPPPPGPDNGVDAVWQAPDGTTYLLEMKTTRGEGSAPGDSATYLGQGAPVEHRLGEHRRDPGVDYGPEFERRMDAIDQEHRESPSMRMLERENLAATYRARAMQLAEQAAVIRADAIRVAERASEARAEALKDAERGSAERRSATLAAGAVGTPLPPELYQDFLRALEAIRQSALPPEEHRQAG